MEWMTQPAGWMAFATLTVLELVLGIDNIVFISILADRLPERQRALARRLGLFLAMFMRLGLLMVLAWLVGLTAPLFHLLAHPFSGRDLILIGGGLFLLYKSTSEIHHLLEGPAQTGQTAVGSSFASVIVQIVLIDLVFSLDSIITAVGMVDDLAIMMSAVTCAVALMLLFAGVVSRFVSEHPTVKMLALAFLFMIGTVLIADGLGHHVPKGYIYFAMAFSVAVEFLNIRARRHRKSQAVNLHNRWLPEDTPDK